jgi:PKD repeat protein
VSHFSSSPEKGNVLNPTVSFSYLSQGENLIYAWTFEENVTPLTSVEMNPVIYFLGE